MELISFIVNYVPNTNVEEIERLKRQLVEKERQMERQKKEMEDKISQIKISERKDRKKLIEERKTVNLC